ncbi:hypothetical protein [Paenibacillus sedimenti]|uniref:Uncharacterized protein n=1 Tax=Paenibacillus sedimenti TaxID=2770274 RepID=A0A926QI47_9BACL|nr:hypothetical protein [Paenibacillus sedimenti]MBD0380125.1 hypothetical protein [Paenibacillus sedimenti]
MSVKSSDSFAAFASLHRYSALLETSKPTLSQAEVAVQLLSHIYGAENEEELLKCGDSEIIDTYMAMKEKILNNVVTQ